MKIVKVGMLICSLVIINLSFGQSAGDTITVNSFNYSQPTGVGNRQMTVDFPNLPGVSYEKIIMEYSMRCVGGVTCGEWDYSCNTYIHDSSRVDSLPGTTLSHTIGGFTGTSFDYLTTPTYDIYQRNQQDVSYTVNSETSHQIVTGSTSLTNVLATNKPSGKSHYLFTASELLSASMSAGSIDALILEAVNAGNTNFLKVKMKATTLTQLDASNPEMTGWTEVFNHDVDFVAGANRLQFYQPFVWDGTSNVIVEFSFTNWSEAAGLSFSGETLSPGAGIISNGDYYHYFNGSNYIESDTYKGIGGTDARTVEAWIKSTDMDGEIAAWGTNVTGSKWVMRFENAGKLRVEVNAGYVVGTTTINDNEWHHVACVYNSGSANDIKLYVDGNLETLSSIGDVAITTNIADGINFRCSRGVNNRYVNGIVDELRMWNAALTIQEINEWMHKKMDNTHPHYSDLDMLYDMNMPAGQVVLDATPNGNDGTTINGAVWSTIHGESLFKDFVVVATRPAIAFLQGSYNLTVMPEVVNDTIERYPNPVTAYTVVSNAGTIYSDDIVAGSTQDLWLATPINVYDVNGSLQTTIPVTAEGTIAISNLDYLSRWPMKFEIMSFVTPYGNGLNLGPNGKTWYFDVTDFTPILKGSKTISMERGGQWQEDMDVTFKFIVGTPERDVLDIQSVWRTESRSYTSIIANTYFAPRQVQLNPQGSSFKVRTSITGHGQEGEFIPRDHFVSVNGSTDQWSVWKECAENPVYPQGGTWIYDRAGWCPGMATDVREFDITSAVSAGQTATLDYGVTTASGTSNYIVSSQLVTYGPVNHSLDATVVEVMNPSSRIEFARSNAICSSPIVKIKNAGSTVLTALTIKYWVNNESNALTYNWTGSLSFGQEELVELPSTVDMWSTLLASNNKFIVEVSAPNNQTDGYSLNDKFTSSFTTTDVVPSNFVVNFKTNNAPNESSYKLFDEAGIELLSRSGMSASTEYTDTMQLAQGCYKFVVYDTGDDGIKFFANNDGTGFVRFKNVNGSAIKTFNPDFGDGFEYNFTIDVPLSTDQLNETESLRAFPNPTNKEVELHFDGFTNDITIEVISYQGLVVNEVKLKSSESNQKVTIDLMDLPSGMYLIRASDGSKTSQTKVVKSTN